MVTTVNNVQTDSTIVKKPLLVVELVGPAGAGKTTLSQALSLRSDSILVGRHPSVRKVVYTPFLLAKHSSPRVLRFVTDWESLDEIVNGLLIEFGLKDGKGEVAHL